MQKGRENIHPFSNLSSAPSAHPLPVPIHPGERNRYGAEMTNGGEVYLEVLLTHTYSDFRTKPTTLIYPFPKQKKSGISLASPVVNSSKG